MTSLVVSGLMPPNPATDPTLYGVTNENKDANVQNGETLKDIFTLMMTKPTPIPVPPLNKATVEDTPVPAATLALYTLAGAPNEFYAPLADLIRDGLYQDPSLEQPLLATTNHQLDIANITLLAIQNMMSSSGSDAIVTRLDTMIAILNVVANQLSTFLPPISNDLAELSAKTTQLVNNTGSIVSQLSDTYSLLDTTLFTPIPYSDMGTSIVCKRDKVSLINLLMRGLFLPQHTFTYSEPGYDRVDYSFVPYLNAVAVANASGDGDNQYVAQLNKSEPYAAGDLFRNMAYNENIYAKLLDASVNKSLIDNVDWRNRPEHTLKRKGT